MITADGLEGIDDIRENIANCRAEQCEDDDNDDSDQHEDQGVFNETLTFFTRLI